MLAIDFDDQFPGDASEVREEGPDGMPASALQSAHAMRTQEFPHCLLGTAVGQAKLPRSVGPFLGCHPPPLASPPASRAETDMSSDGDHDAVVAGIGAAVEAVVVDADAMDGGEAEAVRAADHGITLPL